MNRRLIGYWTDSSLEQSFRGFKMVVNMEAAVFLPQTRLL